MRPPCPGHGPDCDGHHARGDPAPGASIWTAANRGNLQRVEELVERGTDPSARDEAGYTPLHYAARGGFAEIVRFLLKRGADVHACTKAGKATALHRAAYIGSAEIASMLLRAGADPLAADGDGKTPLDKAREAGKAEALAALEPLSGVAHGGWAPELSQSSSLNLAAARRRRSQSRRLASAAAARPVRLGSARVPAPPSLDVSRTLWPVAEELRRGPKRLLASSRRSGPVRPSRGTLCLRLSHFLAST
eukprot:tig00021094_g18105.t1